MLCGRLVKVGSRVVAESAVLLYYVRRMPWRLCIYWSCNRYTVDVSTMYVLYLDDTAFIL